MWQPWWRDSLVLVPVAGGDQERAGLLSTGFQLFTGIAKTRVVA